MLWIHILIIGSIVLLVLIGGVVILAKKPTETGAAPEVVQQIAAQLAPYFGTRRRPGWTDGKDPVQYGEHILQILGQRSWASQELQEFVREHIAAKEFPEDVDSEAEMNEHANRSLHIRRFCEAMQKP